MNLANKTVVITGGSDGLGFSLAQAFDSKKSRVIMIARNEKKLKQAKKSLGKNTSYIKADVSDFQQIKQAAKKIGSVDILINNAGIWIEGLVTENNPKDISKAIDTNLKGVIYTTKAFLPFMKASKEEAHILNVSSTSGLKGRSSQSVYVASKYGVTGFTESLKVDLADTNVKVTGFYPGGMNTDLFDKAGAPKENQDWMNTDKVAEIIVFMIERDSTMIMDHVVLNKRKIKYSN